MTAKAEKLRITDLDQSCDFGTLVLHSTTSTSLNLTLSCGFALDFTIYWLSAHHSALLWESLRFPHLPEPHLLVPVICRHGRRSSFVRFFDRDLSGKSPVLRPIIPNKTLFHRSASAPFGVYCASFHCGKWQSHTWRQWASKARGFDSPVTSCCGCFGRLLFAP
jgi:hypothetical protein